MSVRRSVVWGFTGQFTVAATSFVGSAIVARLVSPREVGVYAASLATMGLITAITSFGTNAYVVRHERLTEREVVAAFTVNLLLNAVLALALFGVSAGAATLFGDAGIGQVLRLLALVPLVQSLEFRPAAMLAREMRFSGIAVVNIAAALLATATTVWAAWSGASYMSFAYGMLVGAVINAGGLSLVGRAHVGVAMTLVGARPIIVFGLRMMTIGGVAAIAQRVSEIVLGRMLGLAALGLYSRAATLATLLFSNLYGTATRIAFSKLSHDQRETGSVKASFVVAFELITGVMWPIAIGLAVLSRPFIYHVYGPAWLEAAPILAILMGWLFVALCFGMNWELFVLADETARQTRFEMIRAALGTLFFVGGASFGLAGAALGRVAEAGLGLLLYLPHMRRLAQLDLRELVVIYARGIGLAVVAALPALAVMIDAEWSPTVPLGTLVAAVAAGVGVWLLGLAALGHPLSAELTRVADRVRYKRARA